MKTATGYLLPLVAALTSACQPTPQPATSPPPSAGACNREAAEKLANRQLTDTQIRTQTGATSIRRIAPGAAVTMDYRPERITLEIDPKSGNILRASCG